MTRSRPAVPVHVGLGVVLAIDKHAGVGKAFQQMEKLPQYGSIQVIDRAVRILDVVSQTGGATLSAIGARCALPLSTVSRILESLASHALIERDENGRTYRLGRRLLTLSSGVRQQSADLIRLGHPLLEQLALRSREDVGLS